LICISFVNRDVEHFFMYLLAICTFFFDPHNRCRKSLWPNSTPFHDKNSEEIRNRRNAFQHNNGYVQQTYNQYHAKWKKLKTFPISQEWDKGVLSSHSYST
jgi:hypothetical protein